MWQRLLAEPVCTDAVRGRRVLQCLRQPGGHGRLDQYAADNDAGAEIGQALVSNCTPPVVVSQQMTEAKVVDPTTGRPLLGVGIRYFAGGGWYGHPGLNYMDQQKLTVVQINTDGVEYAWIWYLATDATIVKIPTSTLTPSNDYFILELAVEPISGTLCFAATGMYAAGTAAAGWFAATNVIPNRATLPTPGMRTTGKIPMAAGDRAQATRSRSLRAERRAARRGTAAAELADASPRTNLAQSIR